MVLKLPREIVEAGRLVKGGRLAEATALIQTLLHGRRPADPIRREVVDVSRRARPASSDISAGLATAPPAAPAQPPDTHRPAARPRTALGETLRGLPARPQPMTIPGAARPAAVPVPAHASFATASYTNAAGTRAYKLYAPSHRAGPRSPLVVMLHGCTQTPDDFATGTRMNAAAEVLGCYVAYPEQPASANPSRCWNWFVPAHQRRDQGEPSLIAGLTRQIMRDHPIDPDRIYIAGLSAGGAMAALMGAEYPDVFAAVGVHSGLPAGAAHDMPSAFAAMHQGASARNHGRRAAPMIIFHGDRDATVHPRNGDAIASGAIATTAGLLATVQRSQPDDGRAYSRTVHNDPAGRSHCEQWTIHGAGHAWAGGASAGSFTDPKGPDATREMLRFFHQHRRAVELAQ